MKKLIVEFIGTMFLVVIIGLTGDAIAIGFGLMALVYMGGHISGAHYNPAVSLAILLRGKITIGEMFQYWAAQIAGALIGAGISTWLNDAATPVAVGAGRTVVEALAAEILFTFALASVVLNVATAKSNAGNSFYGLAIGFTVLVGAVSVGSISGGAFNPAVSIGHNVFAKNWTDIWIHIVGPCIGAAVAASVFRMTSTGDFD
ncbi:MAG: aquaporin [Fimbriimonadaceae bacterium]|nr:aquaporin [Chitinophagales bacterium]